MSFEKLLDTLKTKKINITYTNSNGESVSITGILKEIQKEYLTIETTTGKFYLNKLTTVIESVGVLE